jgi:hypothetical protein
MNSLALQDSFEPYYVGRQSTFGSMEPSAVERALAVIERIELARKARAENEARITEEAKAK